MYQNRQLRMLCVNLRTHNITNLSIKYALAIQLIIETNPIYSDFVILHPDVKHMPKVSMIIKYNPYF